MKNIHIIPTSQPSRLFTNMNDELSLQGTHSEYKGYKSNQNIYITDDSEIKEGDYFYQGFDSIIHKCYKLTDNYIMAEKPSDYPKKICKKIILTTDQDLIKDGVQAIDDEFLEWFVAHPTCEEVEIGNQSIKSFDTGHFEDFYKTIIPKEELKRDVNWESDIINKVWDEDDLKQELKVGDNTNFGIITDIKENAVCFGKNKVGVDIWYKKLDVKLVPKQETTLEEVAEKILANNIDGLRDAIQDDDLFYFYRGVVQCYGEAMAKWQQENSYSEEDMKRAYCIGGELDFDTMTGSQEGNEILNKFIEQFKNK